MNDVTERTGRGELCPDLLSTQTSGKARNCAHGSKGTITRPHLAGVRQLLTTRNPRFGARTQQILKTFRAVGKTLTGRPKQATLLQKRCTGFLCGATLRECYSRQRRCSFLKQFTPALMTETPRPLLTIYRADLFARRRARKDTVATSPQGNERYISERTG